MLSVNLFYFITFFILFVAFIQGTSYFSPIRRLDISLYVCSHCFSPFKEMNFSFLPVNKRFDGMIFTHECKHLQIKLFPFLLGSFSLRYLYYLESPIANSLTLNTDYFVYWFLFHQLQHVTYESTVITGNKNEQLVLQHYCRATLHVLPRTRFNPVLQQIKVTASCVNTDF